MAGNILQPNLQVVGIIIVGGLFGGLAAYTVAARQVKPGEAALTRAAFWEFILMGVLASACVPLFLSLLKSGLLDDLSPKLAADGKVLVQPAFSSYLIFIGLCLIASFSSRRFIDTVSAQLFQRLEHVDAKVEKVDAKAEKADTKAEEAELKASKAAEAAESAKESASEALGEVEDADNLKPLSADLNKAKAHARTGKEAAIALSPDEHSVLDALTRKMYRTRSGIVEDSGVSRNRISELLEDLAAKKLALPTKSPRTGGQRWIITDRGRAAVGG